MKLIVDPEEVWYQIPIESVPRAIDLDLAGKNELKARTASLYQEQCKKYRERKSMSASDRQWLETVLREGTLTDRIGTLTVQIQEAPFYGLEWLAKLLAMATSKSRHESYPAIDALKDIFLLILPPKITDNAPARLQSWQSRCLSNDKTVMSMKTLLVAYFEDILRKIYGEYLKVLEISLHDQVVNGREKAMRAVFELALAYKCDFSMTLCGQLVNKLGDPARKVASRAVYYLQGIVEKYEELTLPIVKLIQSKVLDPKAPNDKPMYYGLTFFSQLKLTDNSPQVTQVLLETYKHFLEQFLIRQEKEALKKSGTKLKDKNSRLGKRKRQERAQKRLDAVDGSSLLNDEETPRVIKVVFTGLTRAIPFTKSSELLEYAQKLLKITFRIQSFSTLLQAAALIFRIFSSSENATMVSLDNNKSPEEAMVVISRMVCESLLNFTLMMEATSYHAQLFKFLYKVICQLGESYSTASLTCLRVILKSLLLSAVGVGSPPFAAATLLLVNEALSMKPALRLAISFAHDLVNEENNSRENSAEELFWELTLLSKHYHPTVSRYAKTLLTPNGEIDIRNEPDDPFVSFGHSSFLESFIKGQ